MPELSRSFGIVIRMFAEAGEGHHEPRFHAIYQEHQAVYSVGSLERIAGSLPTRQERLRLGLERRHGDLPAEALENAVRRFSRPEGVDTLRQAWDRPRTSTRSCPSS